MIHTDKIIQRKPYLAQFLDPLLEKYANESFQRITARNGEPVIARSDSVKGLKPLASTYNPGQEAKRMLPQDSSRWTGREIILILGLSNPLILDLTLPLLRDNQICIVVESNLLLARFAAETHESLQEFLLRPGCHLFGGVEMLPALWTYLDSIPPENMKGIRVMHHGPSYRADREFYALVEERVQKALQARLSDMLTRFEFERNWLKNIILNSRRFPSRPVEGFDIKNFRGALSGIPGLLVSAGPSLKESLPLIRRLQTKVFVLVCDTAYKVLANNGITPHAAITLDAQKHSLFHFLGNEDMSHTVLFADIVAQPLLLRRLRPSGLLFSTTEKYIQNAAGEVKRETTGGTDYIESIYGSVEGLQSGGSVATTAFDLLRFLGVSQIFLVGQDLAYTGRKIHSTGTHHNERWLSLVHRRKSLEDINEAVIRKRKTKMIPALDGGEILSDYVLGIYHQWFDDSIPAAGVPIVNLTYRGALIADAYRPESLDDFVERLPDIDNPFLRIQAPPPTLFEHEENRRLYENLTRLIEQYREIPDTPEKGEEFKDRYLEPFFQSHPQLKILGRRAEIYVLRNSHKLDENRALSYYVNKTMEAIGELERGLRCEFAAGGES